MSLRSLRWPAGNGMEWASRAATAISSWWALAQCGDPMAAAALGCFRTAIAPSDGGLAAELVPGRLERLQR